VKQSKTVWLSLFVIGLLPFAVIAADEEGEPVVDEVNNKDSGNLMLRQINTVKGFQPLTVAGEEINAAYIEETLGERYGAIVLLHDKGEQFESQGVVTPLRHSLPKYGWSTLTLAFDYPYEPKILLSLKDEPDSQVEGSEVEQTEKIAETPIDETQTAATTGEIALLPVLSNQDRIQAALAFLQAKNVKRVLFLGHGAGGDLAIELLDTIKTPVSALILVGATVLPENDVFNAFNFPILDVYGANDLAGVPEAIQYRKIVMKKIGNKQYQVRRIEGADHIFLGLDATLTATVSGWLRKVFVEQADN